MTSTTSRPSSNATESSATRELIVYACPTGELAGHLTRYFEQSRALFGPNAAHRYPPHITLTGFFHDSAESVPSYVRWLRDALRRMTQTPEVRIQSMMLEQNFHGLLIDSSWLKQLTADFANAATSLTRLDAVRVKDWLHLSLAYEFAPHLHEPLKQLAQDMVNMLAPVQWELRLYERMHECWHCHAAWPVSAGSLPNLGQAEKRNL